MRQSLKGTYRAMANDKALVARLEVAVSNCVADPTPEAIAQVGKLKRAAMKRGLTEHRIRRACSGRYEALRIDTLHDVQGKYYFKH